MRSLLIISILLFACEGLEQETSFSGGSPKITESNESLGTAKNDKGSDGLSKIPDEEVIKNEIKKLPSKIIKTEDGTVEAKKCSRDLDVHGKGNLYLAGMPDGTSIAYNVSTDYAPSESPVLVEPDVESCLKVGSKLYFDISGTISHGSSAATNADGKLSYISDHEKKAWLGKSNVTAPLNAMMGVFLGEGDPSLQVAPPALSFATPALE